MKTLTVSCTLCDWKHSETLVESVIPEALMASFSDPERLQQILKEQRDERVMTAARAHAASCPNRPQTQERP